MLAVVESGRHGSADRPHTSRCCVKGHLCRTCSDALWFGLLDHRGRLVRVPDSACCAYDCLVCYVQYEASPVQCVAAWAASDSRPSVFGHCELSDKGLLFAETHYTKKYELALRKLTERDFLKDIPCLGENMWVKKQHLFEDGARDNRSSVNAVSCLENVPWPWEYATQFWTSILYTIWRW